MMDTIHILTLIIEKPRDIPMIRNKVKMLARVSGCGRFQITRLATAASEISRLLISHFSGGKVRLAFVCPDPDRDITALELAFVSQSSCVMPASTGTAPQACPLDRQSLEAMQPLAALGNCFDNFRLDGGIRGMALRVTVQNRLQSMTWGPELLKRIDAIRKDLFADTEESYLENLRTKHEEVLHLLKDVQERNQLLDRMNSELIQLTNDLEELAQERTIIEMSLEIADQIRNPATVIGGLARQLLRRIGQEKELSAKIDQIALQAEKIDRILHRFHRTAAKRRHLFRQEQLAELVRESIRSCPIIEQRNLRLSLNGLDQDVNIHANRKILRVAMAHIIRQAATTTPRNGRITVELLDEGDVISVAISGQGRQTASTDLIRTDRQATGTGNHGLSGLLLVRQILAEHHATITVADSSAPEQGTTYRLEFRRTWTNSGRPDRSADGMEGTPTARSS